MAMLGGLGWIGWMSIASKMNELKVHQVAITGYFQYTEPSRLTATVEPFLQRSWWSLDIMGLSQALKKLPWIDHAQVIRRWPPGLMIIVQEAVPLATWNDRAVIDSRLNLLYPDTVPQLPAVYGPEEEMTAVFKQYQQAKAALKAVDLDIEQWHGGQWLPWRMILTNGLEVKLGRHDRQARLQRFVRLYDVMIGSSAAHARRVDLRYNHGLTVAWQASKVMRNGKKAK